MNTYIEDLIESFEFGEETQDELGELANGIAEMYTTKLPNVLTQKRVEIRTDNSLLDGVTALQIHSGIKSLKGYTLNMVTADSPDISEDVRNVWMDDLERLEDEWILLQDYGIYAIYQSPDNPDFKLTMAGYTQLYWFGDPYIPNAKKWFRDTFEISKKIENNHDCG